MLVESPAGEEEPVTETGVDEPVTEEEDGMLEVSQESSAGVWQPIVEMRSDMVSFAEPVSDMQLMGEDDDELVPDIFSVPDILTMASAGLATGRAKSSTVQNTVRATARFRMFRNKSVLLKKRKPKHEQTEQGGSPEAGTRPLESLSWVRRDREEEAAAVHAVQKLIEEQVFGKLPLGVDVVALEAALVKGAYVKLPQDLLNIGRGKLTKAKTAQDAKREAERQAEMAKMRTVVTEVSAL